MVKSSANTSTVSEVDADEGKSYSELLKFLNPIAKPLAGKKLTKKIYKCVKKAKGEKTCVFRGVKEVQKALKKGGKGMVIFAGDTQPIEVMCHLPVMCEDANLKYCYVPSKHDLGKAMGSTKPTCCIMIKEGGEAYKKSYAECVSGIQELPTPY